jgi:hypothetical protein
VVSLATDHGGYPEALARMRESLARTGYDGEVATWEHGDLPGGCPAHDDVPFAFKPFALDEVRDRGYDVVLWLDAACVAVRSLEPFFKRIETDGHLLFRNGNRLVGEWSADAALDVLGLSRAEALEMPEVNAAAIGLDLGDRTAAEFQERWLDEARRGTTFRGDKSEHRHDQTVAGILAARLGMKPLRRGLETLNLGQRHMRLSTRIVVGRDIRPGPPSSLDRLDRLRRFGPLVRL